MRRLIDANALSEKIGNMKFEITNNRGGYKYCNEDEKNEWDKLDSFDSLVCDAPTVDAVEVVHGMWITSDTYWGDKAICSVCGRDLYVNEPGNGLLNIEDLHYCPNCGAKMDGGNEDA